MAAESPFSADSSSAKALLDWFAQLDPGQRARLRRCHRPLDVVLEPSFHRLAARVPDIDAKRLAPVVWLLAHVRANDGRRLGQALKGRLSELRFRRLLEAEDRDELANDLRTAARLLDNRANILEMAQLIYFWGDPARRRLATEYYGGIE